MPVVVFLECWVVLLDYNRDTQAPDILALGLLGIPYALSQSDMVA